MDEAREFFAQPESSLCGTSDVMAAVCLIMEKEPSLKKSSLCHTGVMHCTSTWKDFGWGCGYRNVQQLLSSLLAVDAKAYEKRFETSRVLSIHEIQDGIEQAWHNGYDVEGASQLHWKVSGTKKWIGTTEAYAFLSFKGLDVDIVQFEGKDHSSKLMTFCQSYFMISRTLAPGQRVLFSNRHPLYFQHQGHSRTIIGIVQNETGFSLLVFDPARRTSREVRAISKLLAPVASKGRTERMFLRKDKTPNWSKMLKLWKIDESDLRKKEYQLLRINGYLGTNRVHGRKIIRPYIM